MLPPYSMAARLMCAQMLANVRYSSLHSLHAAAIGTVHGIQIEDGEYSALGRDCCCLIRSFSQPASLRLHITTWLILAGCMGVRFETCISTAY